MKETSQPLTLLAEFLEARDIESVLRFNVRLFFGLAVIALTGYLFIGGVGEAIAAIAKPRAWMEQMVLAELAPGPVTHRREPEAGVEVGASCGPGRSSSPASDPNIWPANESPPRSASAATPPSTMSVTMVSTGRSRTGPPAEHESQH